MQEKTIVNKNLLEPEKKFLYYKDLTIEYEGQLNHLGHKEGFGIYYNLDGNKLYSGYFKNNLKDGNGISYYLISDMIEYDGSWEKGKKHGEGKSYLKTKHSKKSLLNYEGSWKNHMKEGFGVSYYDNGNKKHKGFFKSDLKHGHGEEFSKNNKNELIYSGSFFEDLRHGTGISYKDGKFN